MRKPKSGIASLLKPPPPKDKGDFDKAFQEAEARSSMTIYHGAEHHNPLELFATTVQYEKEDKLTIYDKTQGTINSQLYVANIFGLPYKKVRVIAPFVGGAFGSALRPQHQLFLAVMASLELKRSIRVTLDRSQMFTLGHRPSTVQTINFGANRDGHLTALNHSAYGETSRFEDYTEVVVNWSNMLYPAKNVQLDYKIVPLDVFSPIDMRAPGGATGLPAIEIAMDDLSYQLGIDPLELRIRNYTERDPTEDRPYSSKDLMKCYNEGAEKFGWKNRTPEPRSMRRGKRFVGYGMATGIWDAMQVPAKVEASMDLHGHLHISSAVTDIGTGTYTVMSQIAADEFALPIERVHFSYGNSRFPFAPIQGGSFTTATVGVAVSAACIQLKKKLLKYAAALPDSPLNDCSLNEVEFDAEKILLKSDPLKFVLFSAIMNSRKGRPVKASKTSSPNLLTLKKYSRAAHSAAFVEVEVDQELGRIVVTRALTAVAAGRIINPKTAKSQILGGMTWGISKALREESIMDHTFGKYLNHNLAEYHIPVHADIHDLDVHFIDEQDAHINSLGIKGVGEIGLVAMAPAISNAIFHATGKRLLNLPIHFDELLEVLP